MTSQALRTCVRIAVGLLLAVLCTVTAAGQGTPVATVLTFERAVRVPGVTLQPGTYVFERVASNEDQRMVQVLRMKPRRLIATLVAMPTTRDGGGADVIFADAPRGALPVLRVWYERGTQEGYSLIYTRSELERIAEPGVELSTR